MARSGTASLATAEPARYQSVVSIGTQCLTSTLLQRAGLKAFSGPFDWIFSSLAMVADCVETNFADLLNKDFLKPVPAAARADPAVGFANHLLYRARYDLDRIFNHYDPRDPEKYAYLRRCVRRLRIVLASGRPQVLLAVCEPDRFDPAAMLRLFGLLDASTRAVEAWVIVAKGQGNGQSLTLAERHGRHRHYHLETFGPIHGIQFADDRDNDFLVAQLRTLIPLDNQPFDFSAV